MPAPAKTTDAAIVATARTLLERLGCDGVTMNEVATAVGVRAPSLYNRFADRAALLAAVERDVLRGLQRAVGRAPRSPDARATLASQARAYRSFAKRHPQGYTLIYGAQQDRSEEGTRARGAALASTMLPSFAALVGERDALAAARVLVPFLHGFVSLEITDGFRLGGRLDAAFANGVATILAGLPRARARATGRTR